MNVLVFEDSIVRRLDPITTGRAAHSITCASFRLVDWLAGLQANTVSIVRPHLEMLQLLDFPFFAPRLESRHHWTLLLNARTVPHQATFNKLDSLIQNAKASADSEQAPLLDQSGAIAASIMPTGQLETMDALELDMLTRTPIETGIDAAISVERIETIVHPHDVIRFNQKYFRANLEKRIQNKKLSEIRDGVFAAAGISIGEYVVTDTRSGPIVIESGATIKPFSYLAGPVYIGPGCTINEHASIKDCVCLARVVKVGGEIEATVIEPYSNKQHHGFLGHSYLGSWINFGAGTCNSDLKNTYGNVNMAYAAERVATDMQFVGCIVGDYAKTAINTSIFTGKTIGTCSMSYGFITSNVPSFVNYARTFGQVTELPPAVMEISQKRMFERRNVSQRPSDIQLLHDMYELTRAQRQLPTESPNF